MKKRDLLEECTKTILKWNTNPQELSNQLKQGFLITEMVIRMLLRQRVFKAMKKESIQVK